MLFFCTCRFVNVENRLFIGSPFPIFDLFDRMFLANVVLVNRERRFVERSTVKRETLKSRETS